MADGGQALGIAATLFRQSCRLCHPAAAGANRAALAGPALPEWLLHSCLKDVLSLDRTTPWTLHSK